MRKYIALALALICVLTLGGCSSFKETNKETLKSIAMKRDDWTTEQSEIIERVIATIKSEITFEDNDELTFYNGHFETIDIKSEETAEMLFQCIRNCRSIADLTGVPIEPEYLPILINGNTIGTFYHIYSEYPETGQFFSFVFTEEDSTAFYEYVMALKE